MCVARVRFRVAFLLMMNATIQVVGIRWRLFSILAIILSCGVNATAADSNEKNNVIFKAADRKSVDEDLQSLKLSAIDLATELFSLSEDLRAPIDNRFAVFLSVDVGEFFGLNTVQLRVDNKEVVSQLYSVQEIEALLQGGTQRLYLGALTEGDHELVAVFIGRGTHGRDYRRAANLQFKKLVGPKYIELRISDKKIRAQPEFEIREWQ